MPNYDRRPLVPLQDMWLLDSEGKIVGVQIARASASATYFPSSETEGTLDGSVTVANTIIGSTLGISGVSALRGTTLLAQGTPAAKTTSTTLTGAEVRTGIITVNQGAAATSSLTLPLATAMDTAFTDALAGDSFDFSVINISTVAAEDADILTNTGWTLVGSMAVQSNAAITDKSSGLFRARKTATGAWTLYRRS